MCDVSQKFKAPLRITDVHREHLAKAINIGYNMLVFL